jgi:hypothetical protein
VLMRREQTLKICANHQLTPHLELRPMAARWVRWVRWVPTLCYLRPRERVSAISSETPV